MNLQYKLKTIISKDILDTEDIYFEKYLEIRDKVNKEYKEKIKD